MGCRGWDKHLISRVIIGFSNVVEYFLFYFCLVVLCYV